MASPPRALTVQGAVLGALVLLNTAIELALLAADHGLWAWPGLRGLVYDYGAFMPWLLHGAPGLFPGQAAAMFVTHGFLHAGLAHLLGNMIALASLGRWIIARLGLQAFLAIYFAAMLAGAAAFALWPSGQGPMVGASGAIFGLAGAMAALRTNRLLRIATELALLNLALWLLTGGLLAWQAHLGGFLAGFTLVRIRRVPARG